MCWVGWKHKVERANVALGRGGCRKPEPKEERQRLLRQRGKCSRWREGPSEGPEVRKLGWPVAQRL